MWLVRSLFRERCCIPLIIRRTSTIFALSSGATRAAVAVIRVSGRDSPLVLQTLTRRRQLPQPRIATLMTLYKKSLEKAKKRKEDTFEVLDKALVVYFEAPRSYTGEHCFELHVHGGMAVVNSVLATLANLPGMRMAGPGEFTRRAFVNKKLELTETEALADLINADTEEQRILALNQLEEGRLGVITTEWKTQLTRLLAHVEAHIDFDESDLEEEANLMLECLSSVDKLAKELRSHLDQSKISERLRSGVQLCILGEPNVGKSSLLNLLVRREAAIVSSTAGTTRDSIEMRLDVNGYPVMVVDTAGLRSHSDDPIEKEGMKRALNKANTADLILVIVDAVQVVQLGLREALRQIDGLMNKEISDSPKIVVVNKVDLVNEVDLSVIEDPNNNVLVFMSCKTSQGLGSLLNSLEQRVRHLCSSSTKETPLLTRARHVHHVENILKYLDEFVSSMREEKDVVFASEHLRRAVKEIGLLSGQVTNNDILDHIFADFCIGK